MTGVSTFILDYLRTSGVRRAYCVPGESFLPLLDAFIDSPIELVTCFHESAAGFMAVADGRLTGIPGICMVSRGPGAANAAIALHTAEQDGVPLIMFVGQVPRGHLRRESFQEIDYARMYGGICKWVVEITDPARLPEAMARAVHIARAPTPGPVVIVLPEDLLEEQLEAPFFPPPRAVAQAPAPAAVEEAGRLLARAERPMVIAGGELASERGRALLRRFAETWQVPVTVSFRRNDLFDNRDRFYAGELGVFNTPRQLEAFRRSDLILALGTRLGDLTTQGFTFPRSPWPDQALVHVHRDPRAMGTNYHPTLAAPCDAADFLALLLEQAPNAVSAGRAGWIDTLAENRAQATTPAWRRAEDGVTFGHVITALGERLPPDGIIVTDAGTSAALVYRYFPFKPPQRLIATVTGCMGFGTPGAIAVALNHPEQRVVTLLGDGGFLMTSHELAHAVARRLPIIFILANNRSLGSIRVYQERVFPGRPSGTALRSPDFQLLAAAHGCASILVEEEEQIAGALEQAFAHRDGPILVEVKTSLEAVLPRR